MTIRSLNPQSDLHRDPHAVLTRLLARTAAGAGPREPVAELERRIAELLGTPAALFFPVRDDGPAGRAAVARRPSG